MTINRMAGCCLILFGIINILHEIVLKNTGRGRPGIAYAIITAALFSLGAALLFRPRHTEGKKSANRLSKG